MYDVYLAAPLFSNAERDYNLKIYHVLINQGLNVYLPQKAEIVNDDLDDLFLDALFPKHKEALVNSKSVLAILDGADADSGTCWEVGFFYGFFQSKRPIFSLRTDLRESGVCGGFNLMLKCSTTVISEHHIKDWKNLFKRNTSNL